MSKTSHALRKRGSGFVIQSSITGDRRYLLRAAAAVFAAGVIALGVACGDDDGDSPTDTPDATATATGPTPSRTQGGTPVETPGGTTGLPEECTAPDVQRGLISKVALSGDDGLYPQGEAIEFTQTLWNCDEEPITLFYPTTQRYVVFVSEADTEIEVWNSSDDKAFEQVEGEDEIEVGGTRVFTETWDQTNKDGEQVPPGDYEVSFFNVGCGQQGATDCRFGSVKQLIIED
jgi:hypothetical protein